MNLSICAHRHGNHIKNFVFMHKTRIGSWGSAPDPDGGACSTPPYLLAGQQGATPPAPSPGGSFSISYKSCIWQCVPYHTYMYYPGYAIAWLSPLITCFAPPQHTQPGYGPGEGGGVRGSNPPPPHPPWSRQKRVWLRAFS